MNHISCCNIHKFFPSGLLGRTKKHALLDVSLTCRQHEIYGIIGPNGAGKSTLLKILMGFVRPDSGAASIGDYPAGSMACRQNLGFLPENPSLYPHLTALEHLKFSCRIQGLSKKQSQVRIKNALQAVSLENATNQCVRTYSKGMKQRLALAFALLDKPEVLILDEPMSGLDPLGRHLVIDIIKKAHEKGTTILFCSHILTDVARICDRIGILHKGRLLSEISPSDLTPDNTSNTLNNTPTSLESFFLSVIKE